MDIFLIPVVFIFSQFNRWFSCQWLKDVRTIIKDRWWICWFTKAIPFWLKELFIYRPEERISHLRIPVRFWLFKCVLKSVIIKSFNANFREVFISTIEIISKTYYRIFCQVNWLCLFISSMLKTCYKVFSCYIGIFFTVWSVPFDTLTNLVSICQTILRNRPVFSDRRF